MRRRLCTLRLLLQWSRNACSFTSLVKAQAALKNGVAPSDSATSDYAKFLNITVPRGEHGGGMLLDHFKVVCKATDEQDGSYAVREQSQEERDREAIAIFLAGVDTHTGSAILFSVSSDDVVATLNSTTDIWALADDLMQHTRGSPHLLVLPVVETEAERKEVAAQVQDMTRTISASGLIPITHVDTLELASSFEASPPALTQLMMSMEKEDDRKVAKNGKKNSQVRNLPSMAKFSPSWFRMHWVYLRTLACKAVDSDPIHAMNTFILPRFDVFIVHLVRAGTRSMNIAIWDPVHRRRFAAKGMLSDILACVLDTHSTKLILVPTNRTDRATLFRCRTALTKAGRECDIVFASEIQDKYKQAYNSDPYRYWGSLKELSGKLDTDLLFQVYVAAGNTMRIYQRKALLEGRSGVAEATANAQGSAAAGGSDSLASMSDVDAWEQTFKNPKRCSAERAELKHYKTFLVIAYTATTYAAYGRPNNPTSTQNFIISTCIADHAGNTVEPWAKYSERGKFQMPSLTGIDAIVTHDAKHFLLLMWEDAEIQKFLKRGGRVWCTMLAEYLLEAQRCHTGNNSVHSVCLKHGFLLPNSSSFGVNTETLPLQFHRCFLLKAVPAIATVFASQLRRACEQCQVLSISHRMDALLAMASMEAAGIYVDVEEADKQAKALKSAALTLDTVLSAHVPPEVPIDMREYFDWGSLPQLHAYFFGGTITIGSVVKARDSPLWTSNLVHLCHRYGPFQQMVGELHLQRYAAQCSVPASMAKLPQRISQFIDKHGSQVNKSYRLVLFDVETTGLNVTTDEIIEIAMYDPFEGTSFTSLVNPQRRITPRTIDIHHITDEAVRDAPTIDTVINGVVEYLRLGKGQRRANEVIVLVGHNVFGVDEPMLRRALDTYSPDTDHDGILFCDSVALLKTRRAELSSNGGKMSFADSEGANLLSTDDKPAKTKRVSAKKNATSSGNSHTVLGVLTASLRLGDLIKRLNVTPEGQLHRADTDTKALWFVLLNVFKLASKTREEQRDAILTEAAKSLLTYPAVGCFVPTQRKRTSVQVRLPGVAHALVKHPKVVSSLQKKPFGDSVLEALHSHGIPAATVLLQRQRLDHHSARFLQSSGDGHLSALHPDHTVRQLIDMTATTTSRTTSAYPSCQNIPKDDKSSVRRLFVSRFGHDGRCIEIDYSQLEIVVLAILCRDPHLAKDLNAGVDFHVKRAEFFSGLPYEEIYEGYKRGVPKYVHLRKTAKQFSFQRLYGAGIPLLHKTTGIPVADLQESIKMEDVAYPEIARFHRIVRSVALRPNNPGLPTGFIVELPTGVRMHFRTRDVVLNLPPLKNYPIQGFGAELAQMMVGRVLRTFLKKNFYNQRAFLTNFVHDSVWIDCHVSVLKECAADTCRILSDVHNYVPRTFPGVDISVPLRVSASCGLDMCSMQTIDGGNFSFLKSQKRSRSGDTAHTATGKDKLVAEESSFSSEEDVLASDHIEEAEEEVEEESESEGESVSLPEDILKKDTDTEGKTKKIKGARKASTRRDSFHVRL